MSKYRAKRNAVSAVMLRRPFTISLILVTGTRKSRANPLMLKPSGAIISSRRISPGCTGGSRRRFFAIISSNLVVVDDLDLVDIPIPPHEADAILVVDPDAVLASPIAGKRLEPIPREGCQVAKFACRIELLQLPLSDSGDLLQAAAEYSLEERLCVSILEGPNHCIL
jgi:hypothetical protein